MISLVTPKHQTPFSTLASQCHCYLVWFLRSTRHSNLKYRKEMFWMASQWSFSPDPTKFVYIVHYLFIVECKYANLVKPPTESVWKQSREREKTIIGFQLTFPSSDSTIYNDS